MACSGDSAPVLRVGYAGTLRPVVNDSTPLQRPTSNATRHPDALDEAQNQACISKTVQSAQVPTAQQHRAYVWLAERKSPGHDTLGQTREKLSR